MSHPTIRATIAALTTFVALALGGNTMNAAGEESKSKTVTLGGGCFWCVEAVYQGKDGVKSVVSGYAGGNTKNPTYSQISNGNTGHAEVIQISYDPSRISYEQVLELFWKAHDPTTLNRQGADVGTQYRSIILFETDEERDLAEKSKAAAQKDFKQPIVTEITKLDVFYPAESYHQDFYENNQSHPYSRAVIAPKLQKLQDKN